MDAYNRKVYFDPKIRPVWVEPAIEKNQDDCRGFKGAIKEFLTSSSIHGMQYLGKNRLFERAFWTVVCGLSLFVGGTQVYSTLEKWKETPINIVWNKQFTPLREVFFPAITFCGQRWTNQTQFNFSKLLEDEETFPFEKFTVNDLKLFEYMTGACFYYLWDTDQINETRWIRFPSEGYFSSTQDFGFLNEALPPANFVVDECYDTTGDKVEPWDCGKAFYWTNTLNGVCYTFNMKPREDIFRPGVVHYLSNKPFLNQGNSNASTRSYPYIFSSFRHFLQFYTHINEDFDDANCDKEINLYIHGHDELPWDTINSYTLQARQYSFIRIGIKQTHVVTSPDLREFTPQQRSCYFDDERELKYFLRYTKSNCELECFVNRTEQYCSCVPFWMPHFEDATICRAIDRLCVLDQYTFDDCDCLSDCDSVSYSARIQNVWEATSKNTNERSGKKEVLDTWLELSYTEPFILKMKRERAYTITDFIAQIGGIFGLFLGCSILSIIEIIYFCTIRLFIKVDER